MTAWSPRSARSISAALLPRWRNHHPDGTSRRNLALVFLQRAVLISFNEDEDRRQHLIKFSTAGWRTRSVNTAQQLPE